MKRTPFEEERMRNWLITGGTPGGFGIAYADAALARGDRVAVTTRRPAELYEWSAPYGDQVLVLEVDVTDAEQVGSAVQQTEERFGGIDVLVNNAGRGWDGSAEGTADEVVRRIFELNYFAVLTVLRAVLPGMRRRRRGSVVMMSSVAGLRPVPGFGHYAAVKHAIEGLSDTLRDEVAPFGIRVLTVEPGAFRTNAYAGFESEPIDDIDDYLPMLETVHHAMIEQNGRQPGDPVRGARAVLEALDEADPPHRLVLGGAGYEAVTQAVGKALAEANRQQARSRSADFPRERNGSLRT
jgi:NAD(P)-dependent dehydrogenase (short-subunit alcohol dehydrogenase family)